MNIKPIETNYKGYRFRSRLEARWAVFFDAMEIAYEYEKEGLELRSGRYLPDFWLPAQKAFVEIKPASFGEDRDEYHRSMLLLAQLCMDNSQGESVIRNTVLLCAGNPYPGEYTLTCALRGNLLSDIFTGVWAVDRRDESSIWVYSESACVQLNSASTDHDRPPIDESSKLSAAYTAARSARFEHGEVGRA